MEFCMVKNNIMFQAVNYIKQMDHYTRPPVLGHQLTFCMVTPNLLLSFRGMSEKEDKTDTFIYYKCFETQTNKKIVVRTM